MRLPVTATAAYDYSAREVRHHEGDYVVIEYGVLATVADGRQFVLGHAYSSRHDAARKADAILAHGTLDPLYWMDAAEFDEEEAFDDGDSDGYGWERAALNAAYAS